jgi:hypothetical protein
VPLSMAAGVTVPTAGEPPVPDGTVIVTLLSADVVAAISVKV